MTRALFVTGTDTGVGKTLVGRLLCAAARTAGLRVAPFKPFESGCARDPSGALLPADAVALRAACGLDESLCPLSCCNIYSFLEHAAPGNAARRAGTAVDQKRILTVWADLRARFELLVVEGAGGLLVPLSERMLVADLAARLGAPLLIVARDALGTINHTLLTVSEARQRGLPIAGVVLSRAAPTATPAVADNAREISRLGDVVVFGTLPFVPDADGLASDLLPAFATGSLDVAAILRAAA